MRTFLNSLTKIVTLWLVTVIISGWFLTTPLGHTTDLKSQEMPAELNAPITYLMDTVTGPDQKPFDIEIVKPLIRFIKTPKPKNILLYPSKKLGGTAAYYEYEINTDLKWILKFGYSSDIPSPVTSPSTVRLSSWKDETGNPKPLPDMSQALAQDRLPLVVRGIEHEAITPNASMGTYYAYDQKRTLVVAKNDTHPVLISLSKQDGTSLVGHKGLVLGNKEDWTYAYSNQKGMIKRGLGWLDSYMYDSSSITIFYQFNDDPGRVKVGVFKWLRAGWKNVNMVSKKDIFEGLVSFADTFKTILENQALRTRYTDILQTVQDIQKLPENRLRQSAQQYFQSLVARHGEDDQFKRNDFDKLFVSREYLDQMSRNQIESLLVVEYIKGLLGKSPLLDFSTILPAG